LPALVAQCKKDRGGNRDGSVLYYSQWTRAPWRRQSDSTNVLIPRKATLVLVKYSRNGSPLGELVYQLKYKGDKAAIPPIVEAIAEFVKSWGIHPDVIVPVPPSKLQRSFQPVVELAREMAQSMKIPINTASLKKTKTTQQMKDVGDFSARVATLESVFASDRGLERKAVVLFDDLFQSGATMNVAARTLKNQGLVQSVYALALTRTRN
jgi:predicted amidophosphoribosyltransferase